MFNTKLKKLAELKGKKAAEITAEELQAVQEELSAAGFDVEVHPTGTAGRLTKAETSESRISDLESEKATLTTESGKATKRAETAEGRITELEGELTTANDRIAELGGTTVEDEEISAGKPDAEKVTSKETELDTYQQTLAAQKKRLQAQKF